MRSVTGPKFILITVVISIYKLLKYVTGECTTYIMHLTPAHTYTMKIKILNI